MSATTPTLDSLMARTSAGPAGCTVWAGPVSGQGAPVLYVGGKRKQARRLAYELQVGPVDLKQQVIHALTSAVPADTARLCINPGHAEVVDSGRHPRTHCKQGHPYAGGNVIHLGDGRRCRTCVDRSEEDRASRRRGGRPPRSARPKRTPFPQAADRLATLYATHHSHITHLLVGEVRHADRHLAEDLTQEAFINAWLDLDQLRATSEAQTFAWLRTIARRTAVHHYRLKRNGSECPTDTGDWQVANRDLVPSGGYYTQCPSGFRRATIGASL